MLILMSAANKGMSTELHSNKYSNLELVQQNNVAKLLSLVHKIEQEAHEVKQAEDHQVNVNLSYILVRDLLDAHKDPNAETGTHALKTTTGTLKKRMEVKQNTPTFLYEPHHRRMILHEQQKCKVVCGFCASIASSRLAAMCSSECEWNGRSYQACLTVWTRHIASQ